MTTSTITTTPVPPVAASGGSPSVSGAGGSPSVSGAGAGSAGGSGTTVAPAPLTEQDVANAIHLVTQDFLHLQESGPTSAALDTLHTDGMTALQDLVSFLGTSDPGHAIAGLPDLGPADALAVQDHFWLLG